jgi:hypothetical protein
MHRPEEKGATGFGFWILLPQALHVMVSIALVLQVESINRLKHVLFRPGTDRSISINQLGQLEKY